MAPCSPTADGCAASAPSSPPASATMREVPQPPPRRRRGWRVGPPAVPLADVQPPRPTARQASARQADAASLGMPSIQRAPFDPVAAGVSRGKAKNSGLPSGATPTKSGSQLRAGPNGPTPTSTSDFTTLLRW
eukprot:scaffold318080_cov30-Tisochrysis_lutea.AAC.2